VVKDRSLVSISVDLIRIEIVKSRGDDPHPVFQASIVFFAKPLQQYASRPALDLVTFLENECAVEFFEELLCQQIVGIVARPEAGQINYLQFTVNVIRGKTYNDFAEEGIPRTDARLMA